VSSVSPFPEFVEDSQPGIIKSGVIKFGIIKSGVVDSGIRNSGFRRVVNTLAPNGSPEVSGSGRRNKFPRSVRLLRHADFERVYKQGRRHFAAHMTVFYLPRPDAESGHGVRVGFTVSKVLGGAVVRNRMKRRLREAVRLHGMIPTAMDVVINPKKSLLTAEFVDLQREIHRAFEVMGKSAIKA
jgi:ribonuclease P protein component